MTFGPAHILVVDDQEANRLLLRDVLEPEGHRVTEAASGVAALQIVGELKPDVVLLDVTMPGVDGLEVCRRLKADPGTAAIPVLLVTALSHREHRLRGIEAGANDYIAKPIDRAELVLRVRNALHMHRLHSEVAEQYRRLQELERLRDGLVHMLVHDLRTPLAGIRTYLELLKEDAQTMSNQAEFAHLIAEANVVAFRMTEMVSDLLDVSRLEEGAMPLERSDADLAALAAEAVALVGARAIRDTNVQLAAPPYGVRVVCDAGVIRRVIANLVSNAVDFSKNGDAVEVLVEAGPAGPRVAVVDRGYGIPPEYHEKIFEKFGQVEASRQRVKHSSGLGLTFCKLAVEAHGGHIGVDSTVGSGSTFWFDLPGPRAGRP